MSVQLSNNREEGVEFKAQASGEKKGELFIVRPSALATSGFTGVVAEGTYEGCVPNKFNAANMDHKIRGSNGDLTIINGTGSLNKQLANVPVGTLVQIEYNGKQPAKSKKLAGKAIHMFTVLTA